MEHRPQETSIWARFIDWLLGLFRVRPGDINDEAKTDWSMGAQRDAVAHGRATAADRPRERAAEEAGGATTASMAGTTAASMDSQPVTSTAEPDAPSDRSEWRPEPAGAERSAPSAAAAQGDLSFSETSTAPAAGEAMGDESVAAEPWGDAPTISETGTSEPAMAPLDSPDAMAGEPMTSEPMTSEPMTAGSMMDEATTAEAMSGESAVSDAGTEMESLGGAPQGEAFDGLAFDLERESDEPGSGPREGIESPDIGEAGRAGLVAEPDDAFTGAAMEAGEPATGGERAALDEAIEEHGAPISYEAESRSTLSDEAIFFRPPQESGMAATGVESPDSPETASLDRSPESEPSTEAAGEDAQATEVGEEAQGYGESFSADVPASEEEPAAPSMTGEDGSGPGATTGGMGETGSSYGSDTGAMDLSGYQHDLGLGSEDQAPGDEAASSLHDSATEMGTTATSHEEDAILGAQASGADMAGAAAGTAAGLREAEVPAGAVRGDGTTTCPDGFPIKGNASSMIYHMPGQSSYDATEPEYCFATEEDAVAAGYRARKGGRRAEAASEVPDDQPATATAGGASGGAAIADDAPGMADEPSAMGIVEAPHDASPTGAPDFAGDLSAEPPMAASGSGEGSETSLGGPALTLDRGAGDGGSVPGDGSGKCPPDYPIKGNSSSKIFHTPDQSSYQGTKAEICFATEQDALAAGYRPRGGRSQAARTAPSPSVPEPNLVADGGAMGVAAEAPEAPEVGAMESADVLGGEPAVPDNGVPAGAVRGDGSLVCPEGYPIKGNASSMIYHMPGQSAYDNTEPEFCFASEDFAVAAGFRAARR